MHITRRPPWIRAAMSLCSIAAGLRMTPSLFARAPEVATLNQGTTVERELAPRESHRYSVRLRSGEFVNIVVRQRGIDVVVDVRGVDGRLVASVQDQVGSDGLEQVELVADRDGAYALTVDAAPGTASPGAYAISVLARRRATDRDREMQEARTLRTNAASLLDGGKAEAAEPLVRRALQLTERARGPGDDQVGLVSAQMAAVYMDLPDFAKAESFYERALAILDTTRGASSPTTAFYRSRLATVYQLMGQRPQAETLLRDATAVIEQTLGREHLWYVRCLATLAALRGDAGDLEQAAEILQRERAILEVIDYADTILYAGVLNNLGGIYGRSRDFDRSEDYLQRALLLGERLRGADDYFLSNPLINLGIVARERKDFGTAETYYLRALAIRQRISGKDVPELGLVLNNLANLYQAEGDYRRALDMHRRGLQVGERAFGPYHHNTLLSVGNIARASTALGDLDTALTYERRADMIIEKQLALNLSVGSERQKQLFVQSIAERTDRTISLHLDRAPDRDEAARLAVLVLLQRKGRVLDAMLDTFEVVRRRTVSERDHNLLAQFNETTRQLADLALHAAEPSKWEERRRAIRDLESRLEHVEGELAEHSAEFRAQLAPITFESVQAALPDDATLLEFGVFRPYDPAAPRNAEAYGAPHYAAYVVRRSGPPRGFDLGEASVIDADVAALREELRDPRRAGFQRMARRLFERVLAPLSGTYGSAGRLLIAPDSNLNLVPFEALIDALGRYLLEQYSITYLTSGRDLLRMGETRSVDSSIVVVANPLFGEPAQTSQSSMYFTPLPGSALEAQAIEALFPKVTLLMGARATKTALLHVQAPSILHVASHGFFLRADTSRNGQSDPPVADARAVSAAGAVDNPLLRSGVALAGANVSGPGHGDGFLTALEASGLDLWGTKLVTLSACDTGVGEVHGGEGVYGLRRAFVLAGAESLVMSLWPVSDAVARDTMVTFYRGLRGGLGRGDALRRAKLVMMQRHPHPFYWASFIHSGEWAKLDGTR